MTQDMITMGELLRDHMGVPEEVVKAMASAPAQFSVREQHLKWLRDAVAALPFKAEIQVTSRGIAHAVAMEDVDGKRHYQRRKGQMLCIRFPVHVKGREDGRTRACQQCLYRAGQYFKQEEKNVGTQKTSSQDLA